MRETNMNKIEIKIIISIVLFTIFIVGLERYQFSENVVEQFVESKKSKNKLLIDTITPIVSLNLSLGLKDAYIDYLEKIVVQNRDLEYIKLTDVENNVLYMYLKNHQVKLVKKVKGFNYCTKDVLDEITEDKLGSIKLQFSNKDYENMLKRNRDITINISVVTFILLIIFILYVKRVFKHLKRLTKDVLQYDPKKNNFPLNRVDGNDEISMVHNAITSMVEKINSYTNMLDKLNLSLEEKVKDRTRKLENSNNELKLLASTDPLTKLFNRRYFTKTSEHILDITKRNNTDLSIIMLDIDDFKSVNDTYGHKVGDDVIVAVANILEEFSRNSDIVCRFGGEEFIILTPETNFKGAMVVAEKIRLEVENKTININDVELKFTVSIGISQVINDKDYNIEASIHRADEALYEAKKSGKNKAVNK